MSPRAGLLSFALPLSLVLAACNAPPSTTSGPAAQAAPSAASTASAAASGASSVGALPPEPVDPSVALPLSPRAATALAESVASRTRMLGSPPGLVTVADTFVITAGDPKAPVADVAARTQKTVAALYAGPFRHRPEEAVTVFVFSSHAPFVGALPQEAPRDAFGIYDPWTRNIYVDTSGATELSANHEICHPLAEADFPLAPKWLSEGICSGLEYADFSVPNEVHAKPHFRLQTLRTALASPKTAPLVRLDALFAMTTDDAFDKPAELWPLRYACAREALRWLDGRHQLWDFYHRWRDGVLDDPTGEKAFASVVGSSPSAASDAWIAWIKSDEAAR